MFGEGRFWVAWIAEDLGAIAAGGAAAPGTEGREVAPHQDMRAANAAPCVSFEDLHRPEATSVHELGNGPGAMDCQPHSLVGLCGGRIREFSLDLSFGSS